MHVSVIDASSWTGESAAPPEIVADALRSHLDCKPGQLSDLLITTAPPGLVRTAFFDSSGAALQAAITITRAQVDTIVGIGPVLISDTDTTIDAPWKFPLPASTTPHDLESETLSMLAAILSEQRGGVVIEPSMMNPGIIPVPPGFIRKVRALCDEHDAVLIANEIRVGAGRTGFLWGCTRDGVTPDLLVAGEGLTSGAVPFGAVLSTDATNVAQSNLALSREACNAATAWLKVLSDSAFLGEVRRTSAHLTDLLTDLLSSPYVGDVRVRGFAAGIEIVNLVDGGSSPDANPEAAARVAAAARADGVILAKEGAVIGVIPSLAATDDEVKTIAAAIHSGLNVLASVPREE